MKFQYPPSPLTAQLPREIRFEIFIQLAHWEGYHAQDLVDRYNSRGKHLHVNHVYLTPEEVANTIVVGDELDVDDLEHCLRNVISLACSCRHWYEVFAAQKTPILKSMVLPAFFNDRQLLSRAKVLSNVQILKRTVVTQGTYPGTKLGEALDELRLPAVAYPYASKECWTFDHVRSIAKHSTLYGLCASATAKQLLDRKRVPAPWNPALPGATASEHKRFLKAYYHLSTYFEAQRIREEWAKKMLWPNLRPKSSIRRSQMSKTWLVDMGALDKIFLDRLSAVEVEQMSCVIACLLQQVAPGIAQKMNENSICTYIDAYVRSLERRKCHGALRLSPRDLHVLIQQSLKPGLLSDCGSALLLKSHLIESSCKLHNLALRYFPQDNRFKEALSSAHLHTWLRRPANMIDTLRNCKPTDSDTDDGPRTAMRLTWLALPLDPEYLLREYRFRQLALRLQGYVMWDAVRLQGSQEFTVQNIDPQVLVSFDEDHQPCFYDVDEDGVYTMEFSVKCKKLLAQDCHSGFFNMDLFENYVEEHEGEADVCRLGFALQFHFQEDGSLIPNSCAKCDYIHEDI